MTDYAHEQIKEMLSKIDPVAFKFGDSYPSIIRQLVDENEKLVGRVEELRKLDTLSREIDGEEIQRLKDELASSEDCTKRVAHQYVHLKEDMGRLQAEVERLKKLIVCQETEPPNDPCDDQTVEFAIEIAELKEQLAKYEVVVEKAIKFCESGSIHHRNQLQEALKHLENPK